MDYSEFTYKYQNKKVEEVENSVMVMPIVSILIQTYNQESYISKCLDSIIGQDTEFDFEVIIGEDESTDNTRSICLEYARKYPNKIRLFLHHRENQIKILGNPTSNFNALFNFYCSRGKYIAFCEGDDYWDDPLKLQKQVNALESNSNFSFNYHSYRTIDADNNYIKSKEENNQPKMDICSERLIQGIYHPLLLTTCFRKNFNDLPEEIAQVMNLDTFLYIYLGQFGNAQFLENIIPSNYRKHCKGIWSIQKNLAKFRFKLLFYRNLIKYFTRIENQSMVIFYTKILKNTYKSIVLMELKTGKFLNAFKYSYQFLKL